jgi:hypothetical protein
MNDPGGWVSALKALGHPRNVTEMAAAISSARFVDLGAFAALRERFF